MTSSFVHLHNHTEFSLLDGAARIDELVGQAAAMGMPAIAVTDHGVMYGAVDFYKACKKHGVKPILGAELYVATRTRFQKDSRDHDFNHHLTVVAETQTGYQNLLKLVTAGWLEGYYYRPRVDTELLAQLSEGLIATSGCLGGEVCTALNQDRWDHAVQTAGRYKEIFGPDNYFIELQDHGLPEQKKVNPLLLDLAKHAGLRVVATNDLHYTKREDSKAHDVLLCIQTGKTMNDPGRFKFDAEEFYLKSAEEMRALFAHVPEACDVTLEIGERCNVELTFGKLHLPPYTPPTGEPQEAYLRRLVDEGAAKRYGSPLSAEVRDRVSHELEIIISMGFAGYFLIVADLIAFAKRSGIRVGPGRGSAAGSVVSYCLEITDLDPLRWGLIFERFLNPERRQMPDIDMDFDDRRRGEMIRYVSEKYGEDHVAQIVTFATIKGKQAIRDAARVLDYPYAVGDRLAKMYPPSILGKDAPLAACFDKSVAWPEPGHNDAYPNASDLRKTYEEDEISRNVIDIARSLEGLRRQYSVHAAGVVIGAEPLANFMPLQRTDDDHGGIVTQYEMKAVEELGLLKMDFLGLRNLTVIEDTLANLRKTRGIELDIDNPPLDDRKTYEMLSAGDTIAVFQLESPGMRELCKRLRPDRFEDVMALVALYRPGPLGEKMHIEYANRKHGVKKVEYLHADLAPVLEKTYGIICYQEQCLEIAVNMAGFTMAEADTLRKAIGKKVGDIMRAQREKFVNGCVGKDYSKELAEKLWEMIDHFSGYGFNASHACGYAFIAFQTAYLKAHYPVEYMAALLTSVRANQDRSALYLAECRSLGIKVFPPDVNESEADFTPTVEGGIRFGLAAVRNVGANVVAAIVRARADRPFASFADFVHRVDPIALNKRVVEALTKAGAFDSLGLDRSTLLTISVDKGLVLADRAAQMMDAAAEQRRNEQIGQFSLFGGSEEAHGQPMAELRSNGEELPQTILLAAEKEMLGVYVSHHPLLSVEGALRASTDLRVADAAAAPQGFARTAGGIVTRLTRRFTKKGEAMAIFTLEDLDGAIEVVVFPSVYQKAEALLANDVIVCVKGKIEVRDESEPPKLVAIDIWRPNLEAGGDPLVLRIPATSCTPVLIDKLKETLHAHPGLTPVHVHLEGGGKPKVLRLSDQFRVERRNGLYAEIKSLLGSGATIER
ncbi:MAG: DNA polymerase III subunit alpha [Actinomycetota bacterium]|nr:DNA polymerase III subunit alpha [Actinomycetota bacterium]